jgi:hypothetical protein
MAKRINDPTQYIGDLFSGFTQPTLPLKYVEEVMPKKKGFIYVVDTTSQILEVLKMKPQEIHKIGYENFENVSCALLEDMNMSIKSVTRRSNEGDGGIDIVAAPAFPCPVPFLLAVQVKHRDYKASIQRSTVHELYGVIASNRYISAGMIVTNVSFSPSAIDAIDEAKIMIVPKGLSDVLRWVKGDFRADFEWRDVPEQIPLFGGHSVPKSSFVRVDCKAA